MARKSSLRAVAPGAAAPKPKPKSVTQAADEGTQRELLVAMRARVAGAVENPETPARDLASLTKRLLEIAREIEAIDTRAEEELAQRADATPDADWEAI